MKNDLISRSALLEQMHNHYEVRNPKQNALMDECCMMVIHAPAVDAVPVDKVAEMLYESFGDPYACNFNGNDEWLPMVCDNMNECPDVKDKLYCWKQFIEHYGERKEQ